MCVSIAPRRIFLTDGTGAFITAFCLFFVLRIFNGFFGMPPVIAAWLSLIAVAFCLYSLSCFFLCRTRWKPFLRVIIAANLLYCCLTFCLVLYYYQRLTLPGRIYFFGEMIILCVLVGLEIMTLRNKKTFNG